MLKIKLIAGYEDCDFCDKSAFVFRDKKVLGLQLFDLNVNPAFKYITKLEHLYFLSINGCDLTKLPRLKNLKNLTILDLSDNKLEFIPKKIKELSELQEVYLRTNRILDIQNIVEITEDLDRLSNLDLGNNKIKTLPDNLEQIKLDHNLKIELDHNLINKLDRNLINKLDLINNSIAFFSFCFLLWIKDSYGQMAYWHGLERTQKGYIIQ